MFVDSSKLKIYGFAAIMNHLSESKEIKDDFLSWLVSSYDPKNNSHKAMLIAKYDNAKSLINLLVHAMLREQDYKLLDTNLDQLFVDAAEDLKQLEPKPDKSKKQQQTKKKDDKNKAPAQPKAKKGKKNDIPQEYIDKVNGLVAKRLNKDKKVEVSKEKRNILITSALPYVNNEPHLGNLIGAVLSGDVYSRYCRLMDYNTLYICGTDEYGTATETKALIEKKTPKEICDYYNDIHKSIYEYFNLDFDHFGRTTSEEHTQIVQEIFKKCNDNGYMKKETVQQVFCENCSRFLADRFVFGTCPKCGYEEACGDQCDKCQITFESSELIEPKCFVCKGKVVEKESDHLFLDLEKIEPELKAFYDKHSEEGNWTTNSTAITSAWFKQGIKPRCITRDLKWGVNVPLDGYREKCFYVWFDAPIGYISITANYTENWKDWWMNPENVELTQFMGKDNVPFHTIFFPASLLSTKEKWTLLNNLNTTEYLNYEDKKFSKRNSTGVFGGDVKSIPEISVDQWRYYILSVRPENADSQFKWGEFAAKSDTDLKNNIGNFCNRILSFLYNKNSATIPAINADLLDK